MDLKHTSQLLPEHAGLPLIVLLMPGAAEENTWSARVVGSVLRHESCVVHSLQQHLRHQGTALHVLDSQTTDPADVTLLFHRKKARLQRDEMQSILASASGMSH